MEWLVCELCGKEFKRKKSQVNLAVKHYCSRECAGKGGRKGGIVECFKCHKSIYKSLKELKRSISKNYFCSRNCCNLWLGKKQRAENSPNWNGGESSYKDILRRTNVKKVCILCGKNDTRILCVHHIDKNRKNNDVKNLVWLCRNCHFLVHNYRKEMYNFLKNKL